MKLLLDANLPPKGLRQIGSLFHGSRHCFEFFRPDEKDEVIWEFAKQEGFTIISTDDDFAVLSRHLSCPPKVIHLASWGRPTRDFIALIIRHEIRIKHFENTPDCLLTLHWEELPDTV